MEIQIAPLYCEYAAGECDQKFTFTLGSSVFFAYASEPEPIAATIEHSIEVLKESWNKWNWVPWKSLPVQGQMIYCEICKSIRSSATVVCDVTTLSFNVLFELG